MKTAVFGAGSWGTTIALLLARVADEVALWEFRPHAVEQMARDRENKEFLPGHPFPANLRVTADVLDAIDGAAVICSVTPSHGVRETLNRLDGVDLSEVVFVSASKGVEQKTLLRMSQVFADVLRDRWDPTNFVCLSGPSHAEEVSIGLPTSVVLASERLETARFVQNLISGERFRAYVTDDLIGVELGGSLKNVIAIAAGIAGGLGFGDNTLGALLTRGLAEMSRLGVQLGGRPATFAGLSGIGDLVTTCCSRHSRNRYVGEQIGKGRKLKEILTEMKMVAEGVKTTDSVCALAAREGVEMPIAEQVHRILFEDADPMQATIELMTRTLKTED